ncbi:MAG TPA: hypothetical protein VJG32_03775 [Anaerolineae bacterium]|nr:hypothetical protein [Anaerolineae bacterium]
MDPARPSLHRANLSVSADQVPPGHSVTLSWRVVGVEANVTSVHLTSCIEDGLYMIERAEAQGSREVIFTRPGTFTFTLTATFGDGVKHSREVSVHVKERKARIPTAR